MKTIFEVKYGDEDFSHPGEVTTYLFETIEEAVQCGLNIVESSGYSDELISDWNSSHEFQVESIREIGDMITGQMKHMHFDSMSKKVDPHQTHLWSHDGFVGLGAKCMFVEFSCRIIGVTHLFL